MGISFCVLNAFLWIAQTCYMKDSDNYNIAAWHEWNICKIYVMQLMEELHKQGSITLTFVKRHIYYLSQ